jgi:Tfp pilus assembly PilM family ATPase
MTSWRRTTRTRIGLDFGARRFKAAQLSCTGGRWRIEAAVEVPRTAASCPPEPGEIQELGAVLSKNRFKGRSVVLAVPEEKVLTGILELPPRQSGAPLDVLARTELARMHKKDADSFEMTCWDLPTPARATNSTFVMAAGLDHDEAGSLLDAFEGQGFEVDCLTTHAMALRAACQPLLDKPRELAAILDLGWTSVRIILTHQTVVVYERTLSDFGLSGLVKKLADLLGADAPRAEQRLMKEGLTGLPEVAAPARTHFEMLAGELRVPLSYLAHQYSEADLVGLLLTGGGAELKGAADLLASSLDVPVRTVRPSEVEECPAALADRCGSAFVDAVGLCRLEVR